MLKSLFSNTTSTIELSSILICTLVALILGLVIANTHKKTSRYSKDFLITLAILPVLIQTIMIMVNGNLGTSVAVLGAFSLVRFRSIPGTSKEILSVIFSMAIGLATGMGHIAFAAIMTLIVSLAIIIFSKVEIFALSKEEKILKIVVPENMDYTTMFDEIFTKYTKEYHLDNVKTTNMGSLFDLTYRVVLAKDINEKEFIDDIRIRNGNLKVMLSHEIKGTDI